MTRIFIISALVLSAFGSMAQDAAGNGRDGAVRRDSTVSYAQRVNTLIGTKGTWIPWAQLENGALLQFTLGERPDKTWGTQTDPPSFN